MSDDVSNIFSSSVGAGQIRPGTLSDQALLDRSKNISSPEEAQALIDSLVTSSSPPGASPTTENLLQKQSSVDEQVRQKKILVDEFRRRGIAVVPFDPEFNLVEGKRFSSKGVRTLERKQEIISEKLKGRFERQATERGATIARGLSGRQQTLFTNPGSIPRALTAEQLQSLLSQESRLGVSS